MCFKIDILKEKWSIENKDKSILAINQVITNTKIASIITSSINIKLTKIRLN